MSLEPEAVLASIALLGLMVAFSEFGWRIGAARLKHDADLAKGSAAAEAAVFALLGLLVAFTFSGAASRFEDRRHLVGQETEAIGTAWLRLDLLPEGSRKPVQDLFRHYVDTRIAVYSNVDDAAFTKARLAETIDYQNRIWSAAVPGCEAAQTVTACMLLLPALNQMFDITTSRVTATMNHPPLVLYGLLGVLSLIGAFLVGYGTSLNRRREWLHPLVFAITLSVTLYLILDLEFPRRGLIRVDAVDQLLVELRSSF